jgi:AhpD family alkylhydroperoxidase
VAGPYFDPNDPVDANDPEFMELFNRQYEKTWGPGAIPAKYKQLTGVSLSVSIRCDACLNYHMKIAVKEKATKEELVEAMRIGLVASGSGGIPTMRKGYASMRALGVDVSGKAP